MKTVRICDDSFQAHLIKGRLENEGISAVVKHDMLHTALPWAPAIQSMQVEVAVNEEDYDQALTVLADTECVNAVTVCPACGSEDVKFIFGGKWWTRCGIAFLTCICALSSSSPGYLKRHFRCRACGTEFH